jgi:hypothetical protein
MAAARLCTTKRAKVVIIISTASTAAINLQRFFVFEYVEDLKTGILFDKM